jgi:hypothetical protein
LLQILLLHGRERCIDNQQLRLMLLGDGGNFLDLPLPHQRRWADVAEAEGAPPDDLNADRFGKPFGFLKPGLGRAAGAVPYPFGNDDDRAFAAGNLDRAIAVEILGQALSSPSP